MHPDDFKKGKPADLAPSTPSEEFQKFQQSLQNKTTRPKAFSINFGNIDSMADIVTIMKHTTPMIELGVGEIVSPALQRLLDRGIIEEV